MPEPPVEEPVGTGKWFGPIGDCSCLDPCCLMGCYDSNDNLRGVSRSGMTFTITVPNQVYILNTNGGFNVITGLSGLSGTYPILLGEACIAETGVISDLTGISATISSVCSAGSGQTITQLLYTLGVNAISTPEISFGMFFRFQFSNGSFAFLSFVAENNEPSCSGGDIFLEAIGPFENNGTCPGFANPLHGTNVGSFAFL